MDDNKEPIHNGNGSHADKDPSSALSLPDETLRRLGLEVRLQRYITPAQIICTQWNICNSWLGVIVVLSYVLYNGGPLTLLYGVILMFAMYVCIVGTLAELASVYPTAGGQYHWTAILSPAYCSRVVSYICATVSFFAWISINCGVTFLLPQLILAMAVFYNPSYVPKNYQYFLLYEAWLLIMLLLTCFAMRRGMWVFIPAFVVSVLVCFVVLITCAASAPSFQPSAFIWSIFDNQTGWSNNGIVFLMGMVAENYMYTGMDGAIHLSEETINATKAVPLAMICTLLGGFVTTFTLCIALLYSGQNYTTILGSSTGFPVYELMKQACRSDAAATVFMVFFFLVVIFTELPSFVVGARLTWALARDDALVFSKHISHINSHFEAPIYAALANWFILFIIGFIYLGSPWVFESFVGTGIILNILSFAFPAILLLLRGRSEHYLPSTRWFKMPSIVGWVANFFAVVWPIIGAIFYSWPATYPVTSSNMNYASAIIGCMGLFAVINWFLAAGKHYRVPRIGGE